ncbi:MAG: hypothetical protein ACR2N7_10860 [Acidimicrobiia bacterium]
MNQSRIDIGAKPDGGVPAMGGVRLWFERSSLVGHVLALAGVLLIALGLVMPSEVWSSDEGAIRLQAQVLEGRSEWFLDRPFADIDPEGVTSPIQASTVSGDQFAPFTKHPVTPLVVAAMPGGAGGWQVVLPSILGSLLAATISALIAGWLHKPSRNYALWAMGLATPLFFYSFTVLHHTLGVAFAALAIAGAVRFATERSRVWLFASALSIFALPFVRREGLLLAGALAVGVVVAHVFGGVARRISLAGMYVVAGGMGAVANDALARGLAGQPSVIEGDRAFWSVERIVQSFGSGLTAFDGIVTAAAAFVFLYVVGTILLCWVLVADPSNIRKHLLYAATAVVGIAGIIFISRPSLSGAVVAMPWIVGALIAAKRSLRTNPLIRFLVVSGLLYVVAVLVTQERHAGGAQWGGRYLMLALPALVPVAVVVLRQAIDGVPKRSLRATTVVAGAILIMTVVTSVSVLNAGRQTVASANVQWSMASATVGEDGAGHRAVLLSPDSQLGRFGWSEVGAIDFFMIPSDLETYVSRYTDQEPERFIFMGSWDTEIEVLFADNGYGASIPSDTSGPVDLTVIEPLRPTR